MGAAAIGAAATGIAALTKASVDNYAEYEQLVGGVETLFKDSAQTVENYADRAFMTAGLSANEYMSTVTSFSASLLQSLEGDTAKAADYADRAIIDMSDNANKMGTDITMIQNAYQGFAKQNYTMLDNLKLGYGGTKEEMQRLLADAEKISGIKYDLSSFADITEAIHVMQEEMGIAGTTAAEASSTISGSLSAVKSQWQNLLTAISGDGWDVGIYISNFVDTLKTAASNLMPVITTAISGIGELVAGIAPMIAAETPQIVNQTLPNLLGAAISLVEGFVAALSDENTRTQLFQAALSIVSMLGEALLSMLPDVIALGLELVVSLATGIADHAKEIIPAIVEVILTIVDKLTEPDTLSNLIVAAITIIAAIAEGLITGIPELVKKVPEIVKNVVEAFKRAWPQIKEIGRNFVERIWEGIQSAAAWIGDKVGGFFEEISDRTEEFLLNLPERVAYWLGETLAELINWGHDAIEWVKTETPKLIEEFFRWFAQLPVRIGEFLAEALEKFAKWGFDIINSLGTLPERMAEAGRNMIDGLFSGIKNAWASLEEKFGGLVDSFLAGFRNKLDIHSPSGVFADIGKNMALGLGQGWEKEFSHIRSGINGALDFGSASLALSTSAGGAASGSFGGTTFSGLTININGANYSDENALAEAISLRLQRMTERRGAAYA